MWPLMWAILHLAFNVGKYLSNNRRILFLISLNFIGYFHLTRSFCIETDAKENAQVRDACARQPNPRSCARHLHVPPCQTGKGQGSLGLRLTTQPRIV